MTWNTRRSFDTFWLVPTEYAKILPYGFVTCGFWGPPILRKRWRDQERLAMTKRDTIGPKMITHTFYYLGIYYLGINFLITQDICYTELSGRNSFV